MNVRWITIHPGDSEKGVHVQVDDHGNAVGGNPHLVEALNAKSDGKVDHKDDESDEILLGFEEPGDEFDEILTGFEEPGDEFDSLLSDTPSDCGVGEGSSEEGANNDAAAEPKKFSFKDAMDAMTYDDAVAANIKTFHTCFDGPTEAFYAMKHQYGPGHFVTYNIKDPFKKGVQDEHLKTATRITAVTVGYLSGILQNGAVDYNKVSFVPCTTKGGWSSYLEFKKFKSINISPAPDSVKAEVAKANVTEHGPGSSPNNVIYRYPAEDVDFVMVCHEIAHAAYHQRNLGNEWRSVVKKLLKKGFDFRCGVSKYAWEHKNVSIRNSETHSECFAMMCHPEYKRGTLPKEIEDYFDKNFFKP